jgi:Secretion system C-terminal sorting domain
VHWNNGSSGGVAITVFYTGNETVGRWEIRYNGAADFYSTVRTNPKPPSIAIGNWQKITGSCGPLTLSGDLATVLPIELTQFDVNTKGSKNHLTWRTASEKDNRHFDIERSTDGTTFRPIGQVKGNNKPSSYQFVDNQPFAITYYRLRQIDFDGTASLSNIVSVTQKGKGKALTIYPNPVSNTLTVENTEEDEEVGNFQIINLLGQQVLSGKTGQGLDVSALPQGTYVLRVGEEQAKFIKQ